MKLLPKNLSSIIRLFSFSSIKQKGLMLFLFFYSLCSNGQIANYVSNGGFELCANCTNTTQTPKPKDWDGIDTTKYFGYLMSATIAPFWVPTSSFGYQIPKEGNNYFISSLFFKPNTSQTTRGYPRNKLKQTLQANKIYCFKAYCSISNQSTHGIDGLGVYFGDNQTDTISQCNKPITYLTPQVQNPTNNLLTDTLNWILLTGTFTANGTEDRMILGNFKSDASTNSVLINPTNLPTIGTDILYDNISCIPIDLPAYAGPDIWGIPTTTVYLGRPQDVGIDEACMWYKLPNTTNAIDTAAGITITVAATTETYMVKQDICGIIKYDTVVVHPSALGINNSEAFESGISIYPNPASNEITIQSALPSEIIFVKIHDLEGRVLCDKRLVTSDNLSNLGLNLLNGVYLISIKNSSHETVTKKLIINN